MELERGNSSRAPKSMSSIECDEEEHQEKSESDRLLVKQGMIWRACSTKEIKRRGQRSPCKLGYTCTYVKVTNFPIFHLRTKSCNGSL